MIESRHPAAVKKWSSSPRIRAGKTPLSRCAAQNPRATIPCPSPARTQEVAVRTLLVDDDPAFRRLASMALQEAGVEHVTVGSAHEALGLLDGNGQPAFDLILLDLELPGMNGVEFLDHLRRQGRDIPVVLVSVHDSVHDKVRALQTGADDYLAKPFEFQELVARLRAV